MTSPILIAGMHRSGTSWVARMLHVAGVHLGDDLIGAEPSNPYGHFEDEHIVSLHDSALAEQSLTWKSTEPLGPTSSAAIEKMAAVVQARNDAGKLWGIKDPRLCLFLPDWISVAPDSRVLVVVRRPDEVIHSLHRRHAQRWVNTRHIDASDVAFWEQPDLGLRLWIHYYRSLLVGLRDVAQPSNVFLFNWNDDTDDGSSLIADLEAAWGLGLTSCATGRDASLGNQAKMSIEVRDVSLIEQAIEIWNQFLDFEA